jgi:hypothetical protein
VGDPRATRIKTTAKEHKGLSIQIEDVTPDQITTLAEKAWKIPDCLDELMLNIEGYSDYTGKFYMVFHES